MNKHESKILGKLKQNHHDLDQQIKTLEEHHYPSDYIQPYKKRKLTLKDQIEHIENN